MSEAKLERWAALAAQGDHGAFGELYHLLAPRVYGLCRRLLRSREAAEDATSEVFLRAQRALEKGGYDSRQPFDRWLLSIAGHFCVDQLRRRSLEARWFSDPERATPEGGSPNLLELATQSSTASKDPSPLERLLARESREALRAALKKLSERSRIVVTLRFSAEMSYDQIAATLGLNRSLVATLLFRAKAELRQALESSL
jgi:RNA polymerase sigma-70 factor (ECF subfamily)